MVALVEGDGFGIKTDSLLKVSCLAGCVALHPCVCSYYVATDSVGVSNGHSVLE